MSQIKAYITSFRLRTLPLALSSILMGNFIAAYHGKYNWSVGILAVVTTVFLQVLSNIANDYGDAVSGADNENRIGPERMVSSGAITPREMKNTIVVFSLLSLVSGVLLIYFGNFNAMSLKAWALFIVGLGAIAAAIKYTVGKKPYGYKGLGDVFVFLFFGLVGVIGTYFLHLGYFTIWLLFPASAVGLLSAGVLNLNNLRDVENDKLTGKNTVVVKYGSSWGKRYHAVLLLLSLVLMVIYGCFQFISIWQWLFLLPYILVFKNLHFVIKNKEPRLLDPKLKQLSIATFLMVLFSGMALLFL